MVNFAEAARVGGHLAKKSIEAGGKLIEKAKPAVETVGRKTIETLGKLKAFGKEMAGKAMDGIGKLLESGKSKYQSIKENIKANADTVQKVEAETHTSEKLNNIWSRAKALGKETVEKIGRVISGSSLDNEIGAVGNISALKKEKEMPQEKSERETDEKGELESLLTDERAEKIDELIIEAEQLRKDFDIAKLGRIHSLEMKSMHLEPMDKFVFGDKKSEEKFQEINKTIDALLDAQMKEIEEKAESATEEEIKKAIEIIDRQKDETDAYLKRLVGNDKHVFSRRYNNDNFGREESMMAMLHPELSKQVKLEHLKKRLFEISQKNTRNKFGGVKNEEPVKQEKIIEPKPVKEKTQDPPIKTKTPETSRKNPEKEKTENAALIQEIQNYCHRSIENAKRFFQSEHYDEEIKQVVQNLVFDYTQIQGLMKDEEPPREQIINLCHRSIENAKRVFQSEHYDEETKQVVQNLVFDYTKIEQRLDNTRADQSLEKEKKETKYMPKEPAELLKKIRAEREQKKAQEEKQDKEGFESELEQAVKGQWREAGSRFFARFADDTSVTRFNSLKKTNEKGKERAEKKTFADKYVEEAKLAEEGEWSEFSSYFSRHDLIDKDKATSCLSSLKEIDKEARKEREKVNKIYVEEAKQARDGKWESSESYFYEFFSDDKKGKNGEAEKFKELDRLNKKAWRSQYERSKREYGGPVGGDERNEDVTLRQLGLKRDGLTEEVLKKSWRNFVKEYHPDNMRSGISAEEKKKRETVFKEVAPGYDSLLKKIRGNNG